MKETLKQIDKRNPMYQETMIQMRFETFTEEDMRFFKEQYLTSKDIFTRNQILQAFVLLAQNLDCLIWLKNMDMIVSKKHLYN